MSKWYAFLSCAFLAACSEPIQDRDFVVGDFCIVTLRSDMQGLRPPFGVGKSYDFLLDGANSRVTDYMNSLRINGTVKGETRRYLKLCEMGGCSDDDGMYWINKDAILLANCGT